MRRFSMLARHFIGLVALAVGLITFGTASMVTSTVAAPTHGKDSKVVAAGKDGKMTSSVTGTVEDGHRMKARFTPGEFRPTSDGLEVTGTLKGVIPGEGAFKKTVTMPVEAINGTELADLGGGDANAMRLAATCDILNLVLGPLDLNLLGLEVHLDQVVLDIVAVTGAGNLLGNLLCAVAGLLDPTSPLEGLLTQLTGLLNQILGALGGLGGGGL